MQPKTARQHNNKKAAQQPQKNPNARLLWSLIAGTLLLFIGLAYGLKVSPARTSPILATTDTDTRAVDMAATVILKTADTTAVILTQPPLPATDSDAAENNAADNLLTDNTDPDTATLARQQELQYLKEVMPSNTMIPTEKSAAELDKLWADFEEHRQLQALIESGKASTEERERYYALRMEKYDEEIALIQLCNDVAANSMANIEEQQAQLCSHIAQDSGERLKVIEASIEELEQQVLFSSRSD